MNVIFFGNCIFTAKAIATLLKNKRINITLVSYKDSPDFCVKYSLASFYRYNNFKYIDFDKKQDSEIDIVQQGNYDVLLCCCWDRKFPEELLDLIPCFNFHASLLPKYRGSTPLQAQLQNKEKIGGVTMHLMTPDFDSGPIYKQLSFKISKKETLDSIALKSAKKVCSLVKVFFNEFPQIELTPQDDNEATYC